MRFAFMTFSTPDFALDELVRFAADTGYDGVELRAETKHAHGVELDASAEQRATVKRAATDAGIEWCCLAISAKYLEEDQTAKHVADTLRYLDLAADIGCPRLRVFGGGHGPMDAGFAADPANRQALVDALGQLATPAAERGITVCLETHDYWCDANDVAAVLAAVDHPNIGCNWDFMHPFRRHGQTPGQSHALLKPWIAHSHVHGGRPHDGRFVFTPLDDERNVFDHHEAFGLLQAEGYTGYASGEWLGQWSQPHAELPRELASLKRIAAESA